MDRDQQPSLVKDARGKSLDHDFSHCITTMSDGERFQLQLDPTDVGMLAVIEARNAGPINLAGPDVAPYGQVR
jgi:hypothetical protein